MPTIPSVKKLKKSEKLFLRALNGEILRRPPFWLMRQAGRYLPEYREVRLRSKNFLDFCYSPDLAVEVTLQPLRRYRMDAAILFSDILVVPDALGQKVDFIEGQGPVLEPIKNVDGINKLNINNIEENLSSVFETVNILSKELPDDIALIGFAGSPWTVITYMVEGKGGTDCGKAKAWAYESPNDFKKLVDLLVNATIKYLIEQIKNGAEAIQLFDSWSGVLSETQFHQWVIKPTKEIVDRIKRDFSHIPVIGFPKGAGILYKEFVEKTGVDAVSMDSATPLEWARDQLQTLCAVQGNLDNHLLFVGGRKLEAEIKRILEILSDGPFIFNLGHGILQFTPPENVGLLSDTIHAWRKS